MMDGCAIMWNGAEQGDYTPMSMPRSQFVLRMKHSVLFSHYERCLMEAMDDLIALQDDWDGYGAPSVSRTAVIRCRKCLKAFQSSLYARMTVVANEWGGVQLHYKFIGGQVCCDFGDDRMSYYIKWNNGKVELHSFEEYTESNIKSLGQVLYNLA